MSTPKSAVLLGVARHLAASALAFSGLLFSLWVVLGMNEEVPPRPPPSPSAPVTMEVTRRAPENKPPPPRRATPPPQRSARATPPAPRVAGAALSGLDLGLSGLDLGLGQTRAGDLAGKSDTTRLVMSEGSVDSPPRPTSRTPPRYPPRARADGVEGHVVLSLLVDASGRVEKVQVLESSPPGVFDDAALDAVRQWRFEPATYQGAPVKSWARQRMPFMLL